MKEFFENQSGDKFFFLLESNGRLEMRSIWPHMVDHTPLVFIQYFGTTPVFREYTLNEIFKEQIESGKDKLNYILMELITENLETPQNQDPPKAYMISAKSIESCKLDELKNLNFSHFNMGHPVFKI